MNLGTWIVVYFSLCKTLCLVHLAMLPSVNQCWILTLPLHMAYVCTDIWVQAGKGREVCQSWDCLQSSNWKNVWILWFSWNKKLSCFLTVTYCLLLFHILQVAKDARSDVESSSDEEETVPRSKAPHSAIATNGTSGANGTNGYLTGATCSEEH